MDRLKILQIFRSLFLVALFAHGVSARPFPEPVSTESERVEVKLHFAIIARSPSLYYLEWEPRDDSEHFFPVYRHVTLRTSGMSPAHTYIGPRWLRLYENDDINPLIDEPFVQAQIPSVQGTYLVILTLGNTHGERSVFFLNLDNVAIDPSQLTVFNATQANLEGQVDSQSTSLNIPSGLTQGIRIGNTGTIGFLFNFRGNSRQYVYSRRFSKNAQQCLILILVPPLIQGSRDLMGHWIKVNPRDLS